jgi:hypothetical protein
LKVFTNDSLVIEKFLVKTGLPDNKRVGHELGYAKSSKSENEKNEKL